jgi:hypothetical protein
VDRIFELSKTFTPSITFIIKPLCILREVLCVLRGEIVFKFYHEGHKGKHKVTQRTKNRKRFLLSVNAVPSSGFYKKATLLLYLKILIIGYLFSV